MKKMLSVLILFLSTHALADDIAYLRKLIPDALVEKIKDTEQREALSNRFRQDGDLAYAARGWFVVLKVLNTTGEINVELTGLRTKADTTGGTLVEMEAQQSVETTVNVLNFGLPE